MIPKPTNKMNNPELIHAQRFETFDSENISYCSVRKKSDLTGQSRIPDESTNPLVSVSFPGIIVREVKSLKLTQK